MANATQNLIQNKQVTGKAEHLLFSYFNNPFKCVNTTTDLSQRLHFPGPHTSLLALCFHD